MFLWIALACSDWDNDRLTNAEERALGLDAHDRDTDGDGLDDHYEVLLGSDPLGQDTDGDTLLDGHEELELGTSALLVDSDGDGYRDQDEVAEGSDPADEHSKIYRGGWPYYADKDALAAGPGVIAVGKRVPRYTLFDQYGDEVDVYDLYGSGPVVVTINALWCPYVWDLAAYLAGASPQLRWDFSASWPAGPDVVGRGDVQWLFVLTEGANHAPATAAGVQAVGDELGVPVPVLADEDYLVADAAGLQYYPWGFLLDEELRVVDTGEFGDLVPVLEHLAAEFPE
jgi:Bacterial TSP3 repeat